MKFLPTLAVAAALLGFAAGDGSAPPADEPDAAGFCPTCWNFLEDSALGVAPGGCPTCERPPIRLRASWRTWFWCSGEREWRFDRCPYDPARECCDAHASRAIPARGTGEPPGLGDYCPACRRFCRSHRWTDGTGSCGSCDRPTVAAAMTFHRWTWCREATTWRRRPCDADRKQGCCRTFAGPILTGQETPPFSGS